MKTTRLTTEEALSLSRERTLTDRHVLVTDKGRFRAELRGRFARFWYGSHVDDWFATEQLKALFATTNAHVEIETPSAFDAPEFEGWQKWINEEGDRGHSMYNEREMGLPFHQIYENGEIWFGGKHVRTVPIDRIPEAARLINALLALVDKS